MRSWNAEEKELWSLFSKNAKILVVDDIISMRKQVIWALHSQGFNTFMEAAHGQKAWEMLLQADAPFDLIISDWHMPMLSGLEFLKMVRSHPEFKDIPFFLVTAENDPALIRLAHEEGVSGYILKPVDSESLEKIFQKHFQKIHSAV